MAALIDTDEPIWQPPPGRLGWLVARAAGLNHRWIWGMGGAVFAAFFALWMFFIPTRMDVFAWNVHPRLAQAFIGAGYVFRTAFFINAAVERDWRRLRWIVLGNLAFTGTLLFATFWHAGEFHWDPDITPFAHIWLVLYIFEPVVMLYLIPRGTFALPPPRSGGPLDPIFRAFLIATTMLLLANGFLLAINPTFMAARWPWLDLNELDARIMAAWFLGWAFWCGAMARARDWDEIRTGARLFLLNAAVLLVALVANSSGFRTDLGTPDAMVRGLFGLILLMGFFHWLQERRRPRPA